MLRRYASRNDGLLLVILFICQILIAPTYAATPPKPAHPWTITKGENLVALYAMPKDAHRVYALSRAYYDAMNKRFLLDVLTGPAETVYTDNRHSILVLEPNRRSRWMAYNPALLASSLVFPLPPAGTSMFLNSALTRQVGTQIFRQPYGNIEAVLRTSEQKYSKMTMLKNYIGEEKFSNKNFGNGEITWQIRDYDKKIIMSLSENYTDNSHDYAGFWSPDGLYFFMILPDDVYMILGPFQTNVMDIILESDMKQEKDYAEDEIKLDDRTLSGELTTQEHYGLPFDHLMDKMSRCTELKELTGKLTALTLHPPGSLQNFGFPNPVGKRMVFDYTSEKGQGTLRANLITYTREQDSYGKYKEWLETLTVNDGTSTFYISCP